MSRENVEIVRKWHEALNAGDDETVRDLLDPEIVWVQNPDSPDRGTFYGYDGVRELRANIAEAFDDVRLEAEEFIDAGDEVVAVGFMRARGKGSGLEVRGTRSWVWSLRAGKIVRHRTYAERADALRAVGLRD
jgi:uncharacterized protein